MSDAADELYAAPPDEFVKRRDALAKELRKSGDREGADAVKKLRKPSASAAVVNRLARTSSDDVEALLAAGEALRQAQLGGGDRDAIRAAARDEREAVEALVGQAGKLSAAVLEEVRETLHAAASDAETRDLVRRGVLTEARRAAGFGGFGVAAPAPKKPSPKKKTPSPADDAAEKERAAAERKAEAERKKAAKERVRAAKAALRDAEKAATAAERERAAAEKALARAERDAAAAQEEVERRRKELDEAEEA